MDQNINTSLPYVIVIEDDPVTKLIIEKTLKDLGYNSMLFENGLSAMNYLRSVDYSNLPAAILSDIMMDKGDGLDVLAFVRNRQDFSGTPFIFLSGANEDLFQNLLEPSSFQGFLKKPLDRSKLQEIFKLL